MSETNGNVTSVLSKKDCGPMSLDDILYVIQGTGSERDRKATLRRVLQLFADSTKKISLNGTNYKIEIDATTGEISILSTEFGGFSLKWDNCAKITDSLEVDGSLIADEQVVCGGKMKAMDDITKSKSSGVEISAAEGIKFKKSDGTDAMTQIGYSSVETGAVTGSSGTFGDWLNVLAGMFRVTSSEVRSKLKTIVQNDMVVSGGLDVQGFLKSADGSFIRAHSESFIQLPFVDAITEADLKNPSAIISSQILTANPLKGDIVMVRNMCGHPVEFNYQSSTSSNNGVVVVAEGESILYAYDGLYWSKVW